MIAVQRSFARAVLLALLYKERIDIIDVNSFCAPESGILSRRRAHSKPVDPAKHCQRLSTLAIVACCGFLVAFMSQRLNPVQNIAGDSPIFVQPQFDLGRVIAAGDTTVSKDSSGIKRDSAVSPFAKSLKPIKMVRDDTTRTTDTSKIKSILPLLQGPKLSDSTRALGDTTLRADSTLHADTTYRSDTTYKPYYDSTYRMAQFVHRRTDEPAVPLFQQKEYALYLGVSSPAYKRELELDSLGRFVTIREKINGLDVKVPLTLTLEDYIKERYQYEKHNNWRSFAQEYRVKEKQDDLANLFGAITNIDIPVPSNPILSIFGPPHVNLHVTGAVDIRAGFSHSSTDQATISTLDQSSNTPNFNQDVQITVDGTIGDKLKVGADWNTQRTFEYENQLKIKYTGYDDEIIQSVEAGNVSLQTPSLIGSSEALFGIKAKAQLGPLMLTGLVSQKKGQAKQISISGGSQQNTHDYHAYEYARTHFLLDTSYRSSFEIMHRMAVPQLTAHIDSNRITYIDVLVEHEFESKQYRSGGAAGQCVYRSRTATGERLPG